MYYKIENKESEIYKKLHELRLNELQMEEDNKRAIAEKTGLEWTGYLVHAGQQNFNRVTCYHGFEFSEPEKVDSKIWNQHKTHVGVFVPNCRTKAGREMEQFITNGLRGSSYNRVYDILGKNHPRRFVFPYVEIAQNKMLLYLDDQTELTDENLIEITKREFNELLKTAPLPASGS